MYIYTIIYCLEDRRATVIEAAESNYIYKQHWIHIEAIYTKQKEERESKQSFAITEDFRTSFTISVRTRVGSLSEKKRKINNKKSNRMAKLLV